MQTTFNKLEVKTSLINQLISRNVEFKQKFRRNYLFELAKRQQLSSEERREKFFSFLQIWSNSFQKAMLLKTALCEDGEFFPTFNKHFLEEIGHEQLLKNERKLKVERRDAILEGLSTWFPYKMMSYNHYEQIVLMNLCAEGAATVFCELAIPALDPQGNLDYLKAHNEADASHEMLGIELLEGLTEKQYRRLFIVQEEGWAMFEALLHRLGELTAQDN